jgi:hypothetical protein
MNYDQFIDKKLHSGSDSGFEPLFLSDRMFDFQESLADWAIRKGRGAIFADCGLGKTLIQLVWAKNVLKQTSKPVLILTPLAVSQQTVGEGIKFGIECNRSTDGKPNGITITNYEKLHMFDSADYAGVVCDESSILKSYDGVRRGQITDFMRKMPYRLLATATAAPNDYTELGTSSEALGYLGHMDMLNRFFKNDRGNSATKRMYGEAPEWRFKGHAEQPFWRWVTSWARACRYPSDMGFDDNEFILPALKEVQHPVEARTLAEGMLFNLPASTLFEQREEKKRTIGERCEMAADIVNTNDQAIIWCHLNDEGDALEKAIPEAVQISGRDSDDRKEDKFMSFLNRDARVLVTKPKIGAWGLNFQQCNHIVYFPSHSFEQYYQAVRRCWRFGQEREVTIDIVLTEGERLIMDNLSQKALAAQNMFTSLVQEMNHSISLSSQRTFTKKEEIPAWL